MFSAFVQRYLWLQRTTEFVSREPMAFFGRTPPPPSQIACSPEAFPLSTGGEASVPWAFAQEAMLQENYPDYRCSAAIVHGLRDEVVPAAATRSLVEGR